MLRYVRYAESEIRQKEKFLSLGELVSGIVHQIKNPLDGLKNCLHHITAGTSEPAVNDKFVARIAQEYARIYNTEGALAAQKYAARVIDDNVDLKKRVRVYIKAQAIGGGKPRAS